MKKLLKGLIAVIVLAVAFGNLGFAIIHPTAYSRLEKANKCSCHSLNPQTGPPQELVFYPIVIAAIIVVGTTAYWLRKGKTIGR